MLTFLKPFFITNYFIPHGHCYLWKPELVGLHILSDLLITLAYYSISLVLAYLVYKRRDVPFHKIFLMFGAFIIACGTTHVIEIWTLWHPTYWLSGFIKAITALISLYTATELICLIPKILAFPSPTQLQTANQSLLHEVKERQQVEAALKQLNQELEQRVLERTAALRCSNEELADEITERQQMEERLAKINACFLSFCTDPLENINQLTTLCGELLGATCTIYSRLDQGTVYSVGQWQILADYNSQDQLDGHICYAVIQQGSDEILVINDLFNTTYAQTDPNVMSYGLKTYIGQAVKCKDTYIGSLCTLYQKDFITSDADKKVIGIIAAAIGVEEERRVTQQALKESEERYVLSSRGANDGLWDCNLLTNEVYFSPRWKSMLGCEDNEISSSLTEWFTRLHPEDVEQVKAAIAAHLEGITPQFENEHRMLHKEGEYRWMLCRGLAVRNADGKAYRIAGSQADITERKRIEFQLMHEVLHDALTGLPNRVLFMDRLGQAIKSAKRRQNYLFAVLFLDIDRFKVVNDSLGHLLGDQLLRAIAHRLEACIRPGDTIARLGGDEFIILVEDIKDVNDATKVAERIQQELALPFNLCDKEVFIAASIGITLSTTGYDQPDDLLRDADMTMYRAKALGKARYEVFDQTMHIKAMARLQLETDLRQAINQEEFRIHYQPIVSLNKGIVIGFEALVRWYHPLRGIISPAEFIPVAEETGLIVPISWWVLGEACRQMQAWQEQFSSISFLTISVNLSSKQFSQPNLVERVKQILQETRLNARNLKLEITESVLLENVESAAAMLVQLQSLGIRLSMDDFGTGYSSLSYLYRLPIDTLKIDRSFIHNVDVDPEKIQIIRTIIALAWNLGMDVVAEGVETKKHMYQLQALRCEFGQGYLFSKPLDSEKAQALIANKPQWSSDLGFV